MKKSIKSVLTNLKVGAKMSVLHEYTKVFFPKLYNLLMNNK